MAELYTTIQKTGEQLNNVLQLQIKEDADGETQSSSYPKKQYSMIPIVADAEGFVHMNTILVSACSSGGIVKDVFIFNHTDGRIVQGFILMEYDTGSHKSSGKIHSTEDAISAELVEKWQKFFNESTT